MTEPELAAAARAIWPFLGALANAVGLAAGFAATVERAFFGAAGLLVFVALVALAGFAAFGLVRGLAALTGFFAEVVFFAAAGFFAAAVRADCFAALVLVAFFAVGFFAVVVLVTRDAAAAARRFVAPAVDFFVVVLAAVFARLVVPVLFTARAVLGAALRLVWPDLLAALPARAEERVALAAFDFLASPRFGI